MVAIELGWKIAFSSTIGEALDIDSCTLLK